MFKCASVEASGENIFLDTGGKLILIIKLQILIIKRTKNLSELCCSVFCFLKLNL